MHSSLVEQGPKKTNKDAIIMEVVIEVEEVYGQIKSSNRGRSIGDATVANNDYIGDVHGIDDSHILRVLGQKSNYSVSPKLRNYVVDLEVTPSPTQNKPGEARSFRSNSNRGGRDRKPRAQNSSHGSLSINKPQENKQGTLQKSSGCFLCNGLHRYRDCPKKQLLNALATFTDKATLVKPVEPRPTASGENDSKENEGNLGSISQWCNTLSHQVATKKMVPPRAGKTAPALAGSHIVEEAQPQNPRKKGLMFVDVKIHGKPIRAMIGTGATHNYLASVEVERLGLVHEKGVGQVKAINSAAQPIVGVAKSVLIKVGPFEGMTNLSVVVMDDFKLILGLEFLRDTRTVILPHVDLLMMLGANLVSSPH
ncbi:hypothetical protein Sango_1599800 [Sesamum angolense]|uniref:Gag-asp_proteas domain-containing protein n=1 Tax=Sesamum angolense TaxID=2727404 RepID=A0AAE1WJA2_9LAMI|nr:hypothetical protein Sango_1599800 [Sesamum angolense]